MSVFMNALLNTLMGMGTVFIVLIFISLIISLFAYIPQLEEKLKGGNKKEEPKAAPKAAEVPVVDEEEEDEEELVNDDALVAVIMAAIIASQGNTATSTDKLVVRSIRRARGRR